MENTYITIQGDAWDSIARKVYGDEMNVDYLMQNNFPLLDVFIFDAGTVLRTPPLPERADRASTPDWRATT